MFFWFGMLLAFILDLLIFYSFDDGYEWDYERYGKLNLPSVMDLGTEDKNKINEYIKNEIEPGCTYFFLRDDLELFKRDTGNNSFMELVCLLFFNVPAYWTAAAGADPFLQEKNFPAFMVVIPLFACCMISYVLYKHKLKIEPFQFGDEKIEELRAKSETCEKEYGEKSYHYWNNQLIHIRLNYLCKYKKKIRGKWYTQKTLTLIFVIMYGVVLLQFYDP